MWLDVSIEQLHQRLQHDTSRPLLQDQNAKFKEKLQMLLEHRHPLYSQADVRVITLADEPATQVAARVLEAIAQKCQEKSQLNERLRLMNQETPYQVEN